MTDHTVQPDEAAQRALLQATGLLDHPDDRPHPALDALLRLLTRSLGTADLALLLQDGATLHPLARQGGAWHVHPLAESPCLQALHDARAHLAATPASHTASVPSATFSHDGQVWLVAPVAVEGHLLGALCARRPAPHAWRDEDHAAAQDAAQAASGWLAGILSTQRARHSEERIRTASLAGSDWLWETNADGLIQWVSEGLYQHTGITPESELGMLARGIVIPRDDETRASWERYAEARARREPFQNMIGDRDTPKGRLTVSVSGIPVFDAQGQFMGYRGASRNITRQIQAEQAARRADQLLRHAVEALHLSVMITDAEGRILLGNRQWRENVDEPLTGEHRHWRDVLRRLVHAGAYPDAIGREDEFIAWLLALTREDGAQKIRFKDTWLLTRVDELSDGITVHVAMDITQSQHDADLMVAQQQALHASEARLSAVLKALPDLWFVIDAQDRYLDGHEDHPQLLKPLKELIGTPLAAHLPEEVKRVQRHAARRARDEGKAQTFIYDLQGLDGNLRHFEGRMTPMPGNQVLYLSSDITARKAAADKLRVSEELYRAVAATISDGLIIVDLQGKVVALNPAASRILGLRPGQLPNLLDPDDDLIVLLEDDLITPMPRQRWPLAEAMQQGQRVTHREVPARRADHQIVWLQMSANLIRVDGDTPPFAAMATFRDITKERLAVQELALSEERWKLALDGAGDGVWDWDLLNGDVYYSSRWKKMLGYEDDEITDTAEELIRRIHPEDRDDVSDNTMRYVTDGSPVHQVEFRLRHKDGHYLNILARGQVVSRSSDGKPLRVVGTHSDITLVKQAERAEQAQHLAEAASAAKSEFLSRMSHEIRTPLNAISGFAQLLRLQIGSQPGSASAPAGYLDQILHASRHLSGLVDDVLDLQRVEAGALSLRPETITLEDELVQCLSMLLPMAERREISMSSHIEPGAAVHADRQRLRQVLMNIGSNAIKYNRQGGAVVVRTQAQRGDDQRDMVCISIADTGEGMSEAQLARLFQPFERLGYETSNTEGTGLGLIITRSLVESMQGRLEIHSQPGTGTQVHIVLPRALKAASSTVDAQTAVLPESDSAKRMTSLVPDLASPSTAPSQALRVLYVEDNRINALLFAEAMRPYPQIELEIAEDGDMAVEMATEKTPHVLVLDAHLPGMSGFDVLVALRALPGLAEAPAYMCSADAMPEDLARAEQAGFAGYWTKPIDIVAVTTVLCQLAERVHNAAP